MAESVFETMEDIVMNVLEQDFWCFSSGVLLT